MYEAVDKVSVLDELNAGSEMYVVDIPTQRVMDCSNMTIGAVVSFTNKPEAMSFKVVANE